MTQRCYIDGGKCTCRAYDVAAACPKDGYVNDGDDGDDLDISDYDGFGVDPEHEYEARINNTIGETDDCIYRF